MTAIFDVVVNTDDLVVLAPPEVIDVGVDFGPKGQRGATFYAGSGNPNDTSVQKNVFGDTVVPIQGDIYINVAGGSNYGWLYLYNPQVTGDDWNQLLRLDPPIYNKSKNQTFTTGTTVISIPVAEIIPSGTSISDAYSYVVNLTPRSLDPVVLTINTQSISGTNLLITVEGLKFNGTWSVIDAQAIDISVLVTVV